MTVRHVALGCAVFGLSIAAFAQTPPRQDGRWQVTIEMNMAGMSMPGFTTEQCLTPEDIKNPQNVIPQGGPGRGRGRGNDGNCVISDYAMKGNTASWTMACTGQMAMTGTGQMTYEGDTYQGSMNMMANGQQMQMKLAGKRLGDCTTSTIPR